MFYGVCCCYVKWNYIPFLSLLQRQRQKKEVGFFHIYFYFFLKCMFQVSSLKCGTTGQSLAGECVLLQIFMCELVAWNSEPIFP